MPFDLDGVIRHFDPKHVADIEQQHRLSSGTLESIAFAKPLIEEGTAGRISRADWVCHVSEMVGSASAAEEWGVYRQIDPICIDARLLPRVLSSVAVTRFIILPFLAMKGLRLRN